MKNFLRGHWLAVGLVMFLAGCTVAYAAQGYLAHTEWGVRLRPVAGNALPDNCTTGNLCLWASPAPSPLPEFWNGIGNETVCTKSNGVCGPTYGAPGVPTLNSVNSNAGSGASASVLSGTDTQFEIQIVSGTGAIAGTWATFNFGNAWASKPYCIAHGSTGTGAGDGTSSGYSVYASHGASSTTLLVIAMGTATGSSSKVFQFVVICAPQ